LGYSIKEKKHDRPKLSLQGSDDFMLS